MSLLVIRPGMLTTMQDLGRWGHQHRGVPVAGPMDWSSHRLADQLLGNEMNAAALGIAFDGTGTRSVGIDDLRGPGRAL